MDSAEKVFSALKYPVYYNDDSQKVLDQEGKLVVDIRGWGWINKLGKDESQSEQLQDAFGEEIAAMINNRNNSELTIKHMSDDEIVMALTKNTPVINNENKLRIEGAKFYRDYLMSK